MKNIKRLFKRISVNTLDLGELGTRICDGCEIGRTVITIDSWQMAENDIAGIDLCPDCLRALADQIEEYSHPSPKN